MVRSSIMTSTNHLLRPAPIIYYDQHQSSMMTELRNKVKSGEEL